MQHNFLILSNCYWASLNWTFLLSSCTQIDGSRLFKDVKAYYAAVKGGFAKHGLNPQSYWGEKLKTREVKVFYFLWETFAILSVLPSCKDPWSRLKKKKSRRSIAYVSHVWETVVFHVVSFCACIVSSSQETSVVLAFVMWVQQQQLIPMESWLHFKISFFLPFYRHAWDI